MLRLNRKPVEVGWISTNGGKLVGAASLERSRSGTAQGSSLAGGVGRPLAELTFA